MDAGGGGEGRADVQSSSVWTALGWMEEEASFWPANLGARAMMVEVWCLVGAKD